MKKERILITAVPGSGKTTWIEKDAKKKLDQIDNEVIYILTFSNEACESIQSRFGNDDRVCISTIHSLAGRILNRDNNYSILFDEDKLYEQEPYDSVLIKATEVLNRPDYNETFDYVYLDEAQDLTELQYEFMKALVERSIYFAAVGDPLQSIYEFANADSKYMYKFDYTETKTLQVSYRIPKNIAELINYAYGTSIEPYKKNREEGFTLRCVMSDSVKLVTDLVKNNMTKTTAIIVRTNQEVKKWYSYLKAIGLSPSVRYSGFTPLTVATIASAQAYHMGISKFIFPIVAQTVSPISTYDINKAETMVKFPITMDEMENITKNTLKTIPPISSSTRLIIKSIQRTLNIAGKPKFLSMKSFIETAKKLSNIIPDDIVGYIKAADMAYRYFYNGEIPTIEINGESPIKIITAHSSKGLEFDNVVVILDRFHPEFDKNVGYVAMTRAKENLMVAITSEKGRMKNKPNFIDSVFSFLGDI